jgi:hypothetical protein
MNDKHSTSAATERKPRHGARGSQTRMAVIRALSAAQHALSMQYLRNVTGLQDDALKAALVGLRTDGLVACTGHGQASYWTFRETVQRHRALMTTSQQGAQA